MDKWQMTVCAIALHCNGYSKDEIATALGVDTDQAQQLIEAGADAQATGQMGYMQSGRKPNSRNPTNPPSNT